MTTLGPLDHLTRVALPWRAAHLTECGRPLGEVRPERLITRDELDTRIKLVGQARAAYTVCMTCADTARRHPPSPFGALQRELEFAVAGGYDGGPARRLAGRSSPWLVKHLRDAARADELAAEIEAIVALVAAHRDEFDGFLRDRAGATSLERHRAARTAAAAAERRGL